MPGCSSPPSSTSQSSCSTCSFWGVIPIRSHQKWWTFPCLGGWCRRPWSISQRRQVLGVIFPGWWCLATFRIFQAPELGDYQCQWLGSWLGISQQIREADRKHFFFEQFSNFLLWKDRKAYFSSGRSDKRSWLPPPHWHRAAAMGRGPMRGRRWGSRMPFFASTSPGLLGCGAEMLGTGLRIGAVDGATRVESANFGPCGFSPWSDSIRHSAFSILQTNPIRYCWWYPMIFSYYIPIDWLKHSVGSRILGVSLKFRTPKSIALLKPTSFGLFVGSPLWRTPALIDGESRWVSWFISHLPPPKGPQIHLNPEN